MIAEGGLNRRLLRAFGIQAGAIAVAAVLGVIAAFYLLEELLLTQALRQEATYFWEQKRSSPDFPPPDTRNLTGFLARADEPTDWLGRPMPNSLGHHVLVDSGGPTLVHVSEVGGERLYLVYAKEQVRGLAVYFGVLPLAAVLALIYLAAFSTYRLAQRAVSPIVRLAREVNRLDPKSGEVSFSASLAETDLDHEVRILAAAIERYANRLSEYVRREWEFTRDVSHELRTPLTVIKMAAKRIEAEDSLSESASKALNRVLRSAQDMEELTAAFLLLARETDDGADWEAVCINQVADEELERARFLAEGKPLEFALQSDCDWYVQASGKVVSSLIGNLVRNAVNYTEAGNIRVVVKDGVLNVIDSGIGIEADQVEKVFSPFFRASENGQGGTGAAGFGVGLTIVKRLSDRFGWRLSIESEPSVGTRVQVWFPDATREPSV